MPRSIIFWAFLLTCVALVAGGSARAGVIAIPPPGPARVANADAVIVGKVEGVEPQDVKVGTTTYRIAIVKITDRVRGIKEEKTIRIGFIPVEKPKPMVFVSGARAVQLEVGKEGLFILTKVGKEKFYTIGGVVGYYVNSDKNTSFGEEVKTAKAAVKALANPQAALKSKDADMRLFAAAILVDKYRTYRGPQSKQEAIGADESKLILQAIADADWPAQGNFTSLRPSPGQLFQQLGVTAKDGFVVPAGANFQAAARAWVRDNVGKYRIQRFVAAEAK